MSRNMPFYKDLGCRRCGKSMGGAEHTENMGPEIGEIVCPACRKKYHQN